MTEEVREENQMELEESKVIDATTAEPAAGEESVPEEASAEEKIAQLEAQLAAAEQKAAEHLDGWQRTQASFANYRKRTEAEQVTLRSAANAALLGRFLPVLDDFARAFQALPPELAKHSWVGGLTLIQRKIAAILESENVKPIELQPGDAFDPLYHQAVVYQETAGFEDGQVVAEVERGYALGERLLRPASVVVAKAPPRAPEPESEVGADVIDAEVVTGESACCDDEPGECPEQDAGCCGNGAPGAAPDPA